MKTLSLLTCVLAAVVVIPVLWLVLMVGYGSELLLELITSYYNEVLMPTLEEK